MTLHRLAWVALSFMLLSAFTFGYWAFWPVDVFRYEAPLKIVNVSPNSDGTFVKFKMEYCKNPSYRDLQADVTISLSNTLVYNLAGVSGSILEPGCHAITEGVELPVMPAGRYRLFQTRKYQATPFKLVTVHIGSDEFELK